MNENAKPVLTLHQGYQTVYDFTGQASEINRSLALAGIAVIWVFKTGDGAAQAVPAELIPPALALVAALGLDLMQYLIGALLWYVYTRNKEAKQELEFTAPAAINLPGTLLFILKMVATVVAYLYLLVFLVPKIAGG